MLSNLYDSANRKLLGGFSSQFLALLEESSTYMHVLIRCLKGWVNYAELRSQIDLTPNGIGFGLTDRHQGILHLSQRFFQDFSLNDFIL
jgi:hypothetical protein